MDIWFTARKSFGPHNGTEWTRYIEWSGLTQLTELISLDQVLCPSIFMELIEEDWNYNIHKNHRISYFRNLAHVVKRASTQRESVNVFAVVFEPESDPKHVFSHGGFEFMGFDLIDEGSDISALTNCGGFDKAFNKAEITSVGLLENYEDARRVQTRLRHFYPGEPHADCALWAMWKLKRI